MQVVDRTEDEGSQPETAKPKDADGKETLAENRAEPGQSALSDDLFAALRAVDEKFDELPTSKRRTLLAEWLMTFRKRVGYFRCIEELSDAFIEAQRGLLPPLFKPTETCGRPPLPLVVEDIRGAAALAMDALMQSGMRKQDAARAVAKRLGYSVASRDGWTKVAKWRDDLARAAGDKGRYSNDYRLQARLHEELRADLFCAVKERGEDPQSLAADQYARIDLLRQRLSREKGDDLSSI
jgi:hypothetical protein